jgi:peptidoglycan/LPS O-acetylase OafA/YrhL
VGSLRLMLAFAVAGGHALGAFNFPNIYLAGGEAVQIFYMISGFLIALILRGKYADSANGNWIFYSNRAAKIFVPYAAWSNCCAVCALLCLHGKSRRAEFVC